MQVFSYRSNMWLNLNTLVPELGFKGFTNSDFIHCPPRSPPAVPQVLIAARLSKSASTQGSQSPFLEGVWPQLPSWLLSLLPNGTQLSCHLRSHTQHHCKAIECWLEDDTPVSLQPLNTDKRKARVTREGRLSLSSSGVRPMF